MSQYPEATAIPIADEEVIPDDKPAAVVVELVAVPMSNSFQQDPPAEPQVVVPAETRAPVSMSTRLEITRRQVIPSRSPHNERPSARRPRRNPDLWWCVNGTRCTHRLYTTVLQGSVGGWVESPLFKFDYVME